MIMWLVDSLLPANSRANCRGEFDVRLNSVQSFFLFFFFYKFIPQMMTFTLWYSIIIIYRSLRKFGTISLYFTWNVFLIEFVSSFVHEKSELQISIIL